MSDPIADKPASEPGQRGRIVVLLLVVAGLVAVIAWQTYLPLPEGISRSEYTRAVRMYESRRGREPTQNEVLVLLGELAVRDGELDHAVVCFRAVPNDDPQGRSARLQEAQILAQLNRVAEAEASFREYLALVRGDSSVDRTHLTVAYQWMVFLLSAELRFEERRDLLAEMHERGLGGVWDSRLYCFPQLVMWQGSDGRDKLEAYLQADPDNPLLLLASARYRTIQGESAQAWAILNDLQRRMPDDRRVTAAMLECAFQDSDWDRFTEIVETVSEYADDEPWLLTRMRGEFALHEERWEDAIREFQRVLADDPADSRAEMGLAQAYETLGREEASNASLARTRILSEIRGHLALVTESDPAASRKLSELCRQVEMDEAAAIFERHANRIEQSSTGSPDGTNSLPGIPLP